MTAAEELLKKAQDIALRAFEQPSQETVMELWRRLCEEEDRRKYAADEARLSGALH